MAMTSSIFGMAPPSATEPVANPTWYGDIRYMFTAADAAHMGYQGLDLTNYDAVVASAGPIYGQVAMGTMPPGNPWPAAWTETFLNWMSAGFPKGTAPYRADALAAMTWGPSPRASRVRKDITALGAADATLLSKAFAGILAKDNDDPNSYFVQAGFHWLPPPLYCQHHVPAYNPWHRAYLLSFENALRSVEGCESVTLPYWDITKPFPDILKSPPFDKYTLPVDIGGGFRAGYTTQRYPYADIQAKLVGFDVAEDIDRAMSKTGWEDFHGMFAGTPNNTIISAHDGGHLAIGDTMRQQSVAAFDPVFWFFHCNWDRLFWKWQQEMNATTLTGLLTTITDVNSRNIFAIPVLQAIEPFTSGALKLKTVSVVDSVGDIDVDYEHPAESIVATKTAPMRRALSAGRTVRADVDRVNVRIDGINRLQIPGSFAVHLLKDGQALASKGFFQPVEAEKCESCAKNAVVHFDFDLSRDAIAGGKLSVRVEPVDASFVGPSFPAKMMGNPTIEVNVLLQHE